MALSRQDRFALWSVADEKCDWGNEPISFSEMEVDHLIPRSLKDEALAAVLKLHGLPSSFDLESIENLGPTCRRCNGDKSNRVLPSAPGFAFVLDRAAKRADDVRRTARFQITRRDVEKAMAQLEFVRDDASSDPEIAQLCAEFMIELRTSDSTTNATADSLTLDLHPALATLWDPGRRWSILEVLSPEVAVLTDGRVSGYTGTHPSFECPFCHVNGPWSGSICRNCGQRSDPWD